MNMPPAGATIGVAFSGGVDSAVSVRLLREQGYTVEAWHMLTCAETVDDRTQALAEALEVPLHVVDLREPFEAQVVAPFYAAYAAGLTPNPCARCNPALKFGLLQAAIHRWMATGHYVALATEPESGARTLRCATDRAKDQSYFLCGLTPEQLAHVCFPLADKTRAEVVALARAWQLPIPEAKLASGSQDICFLNGRDYREELMRRHPEVDRPGPIVDSEGKVLGTHRGLAHYTRGQRKGVGVAMGDRAFVVKLDWATNTLVLGPREALEVSAFRVVQQNWLVPPVFPLHCQAVSRYHHAPFDCVVQATGEVEAASPQTLVTPGQVCAFYRGDYLLGGGLIAP